MKVLDYINNRNYKLTLEKLIIGVEEPIFIKGVGEVLAKADSGNSAFNVLHGEDFYNQGDVVVFTSYDEEDKPHRVSKKVQGTVDINIGAGHTETRPIVLLDVKFAGEEYINVPFTIGNRATNKNKVLLGKEFLTKELDVLIDVSKDNISDKNIEVDVPVTEDTTADRGENNFFNFRQKNNPSGATSKVMRGATKTYGALKGAYNMLKNWGNSEQGIFSKIKTARSDWKQMMADINNYQKTDKELIFRHIAKMFHNKHQRMDDIFNNPQVIKILDYLGNDYAGNNNIKQNSTASTNAQRSRVSEAVEATAQQSPNPTENQQKAEVESSGQTGQNNLAIFKKAKSVVNNEAKTIVYLIIYDGDKVNAAKQVLSANYQKFNDDFSQLIAAVEMSAGNEHMQSVSNNIVDTLIQNDIPAAIVACSGIKENRIVTNITDIFKFANGAEEEQGQEQGKVDKQSTDSKQSTNVEPIPNPEIENIFGEKLNSLDSSLSKIDHKMATDFIGSYGANADDIYSYPVFSFTDKSSIASHNAKDTNVNKKVVLYYMVFSKSDPSVEEMAKSLQKGKDAIGKLIPFFDIDSISDAANSYISQFNAATGQNGILVACFGDETDRRGLFLGGKTEKNAAINPKMLSFDKKRDNKKESANRQKSWKNFISTLPTSSDDYTQEQYNQLFDKINRLTAGKNNYMVPMPRSFNVQNSVDENIQSVAPDKNNRLVLRRKGNDGSIYEYEILSKNFQKYITLRDIEKPDIEEVDDASVNDDTDIDENSKEVTEPEVIDNEQSKDEIDIQTPENSIKNNNGEGDANAASKIKNNANSESETVEKTTKPKRTSKKKKEIANVIITDKEDKKPARKPGRPKGSTNRAASKRIKLDKDEFKWVREQPLVANADARKASSAIMSHSISKDAQDSIKKMLLDI